MPYLDLSPYAGDDKERLTLEAMTRGERLIYGGRIAADDLLGDPDLLRREGDGYIAGDIKSGAGEEGAEDGRRPKKHYAVQLALYTDILHRLRKSAGRRGFVWDIHGDEVVYEFDALQGVRNPRTLWQDYQDALAEGRAIIRQTTKTLPAYASGTCKNCYWYSACLTRLQKADDLTLIPQLGRSKRDVMIQDIATIRDLATTNPNQFIQGKKTTFPGIGPDTLRKFHSRAQLISGNGRPYLRQPLTLPKSDTELFFDIEVDPMRDVCYLHGFVERRQADNPKGRYVAFFADEPTAEAEEHAFAEAWRFMKGSRPCVMYYYSKYERTIYRKLRAKYPRVCTVDELEAMFDPATAVDLYYDVVLKATEWPTRDYSIKTLARYLGFNWRDPHPSGAASIEWFDRWVRTGDPTIRQRILDYNEDDCQATRVLVDSIRTLEAHPRLKQ
jgi:predicted RecB family nuclease